MVACIDFFEMSEICRPKFIVRHSTNFFIRRLGSRRVYQKEKKKGGVVIKKIGDGKYCAKSSDVI
jgi:hypothetical protein